MAPFLQSPEFFHFISILLNETVSRGLIVLLNTFYFKFKQIKFALLKQIKYWSFIAETPLVKTELNNSNDKPAQGMRESSKPWPAIPQDWGSHRKEMVLPFHPKIRVEGWGGEQGCSSCLPGLSALRFCSDGSQGNFYKVVKIFIGNYQHFKLEPKQAGSQYCAHTIAILLNGFIYKLLCFYILLNIIKK